MRIDVQQLSDQITYFLWVDEGEDGMSMDVQQVCIGPDHVQAVGHEH
jgi:hypothetical protein